MTRHCFECVYYRYEKVDEFAGKVGTCRYNPPIYEVNAFNRYPKVKHHNWCGKFTEAHDV